MADTACNASLMQGIWPTASLDTGLAIELQLQRINAILSMKNTLLTFKGQLGHCGDREVFIGFATAAELGRISFPDVLDEVTGNGYQRRFNREHSLEFKRYIQEPGATTIPLTFNLRPDRKGWKVKNGPSGATLSVDISKEPVMAQVDCQHRLGYLRGSQIPFAFMAYIGLSIDEEMEIFRVINGKAKGLSGSLLDFTEARLVEDDLKTARPELFLALVLHEDQRSPWYQRLDLGGNRTTGPLRIPSLCLVQTRLAHADFARRTLAGPLGFSLLFSQDIQGTRAIGIGHQAGQAIEQIHGPQDGNEVSQRDRPGFFKPLQRRQTDAAFVRKVRLGQAGTIGRYPPGLQRRGKCMRDFVIGHSMDNRHIEAVTVDKLVQLAGRLEVLQLGIGKHGGPFPVADTVNAKIPNFARQPAWLLGFAFHDTVNASI